MFDIIKRLEESKPKAEVVKPTLLQVVVSCYKRWKNKRAFKALALAKREEKAVLVKTNLELADELDERGNALIEQSARLMRTDRVEADRLFEEAADLSAQANTLRYMM